MSPRTRQRNSSSDLRSEQKGSGKRSNARNATSAPAKRRKVTAKGAQQQIKDRANELLYYITKPDTAAGESDKANGGRVGLEAEVEAALEGIGGAGSPFEDARKLVRSLEMAAEGYHSATSQLPGISKPERPAWRQSKDRLAGLNRCVASLASERIMQKIVPGPPPPPKQSSHTPSEVEMLAHEVLGSENDPSQDKKREMGWGDLAHKTFKAFEGILGGAK